MSTQNKSQFSKTSLVLCLSFVTLLPQYLIRSDLATLYYMYNHFTTYFGDLWYCFNNYLSHGFPFPREYPSGIQLLFRLISQNNLFTTNYTAYMLCISLLLSIFALISTYFLYLSSHDYKKIILFWILAPSYLFYGLFNLDYITISTMIISYYWYNKTNYYNAIIILALGTAIKVFPIFILPIYLLRVNNHLKFKLFLVFIGSWISFNLPFMLYNFQDWVFPYLWQIQNNYAKDSTDGSWTWLLFQALNHFQIGNLSGKISLGGFALLYFLIIKKYRTLNLARHLTIVIILFLLTDRVYSPQYNLYLLPCLVLLDYTPRLRYFYLLEIPNVLQGFFLFFIKIHPLILQSILVCKYLGIIFLLREVIKTPQPPFDNTIYVTDSPSLCVL